MRVYAVGHSTRPLEELVSLLWSHGVATVVDIRRFPRSRTNPQFNLERLEEALPAVGVRYVHLAKLGGLRARKGEGTATSAAWRNASFRAYADYMQTEDFEAGLAELRRLAAEGPPALMCAEALRWRCHRSLVSDALTAWGAEVLHIESAVRVVPHRPPAFARFADGAVTYPLEAEAPV